MQHLSILVLFFSLLVAGCPAPGVDDDDDDSGTQDDDDSSGDDDDSSGPELFLGGAPRNPLDAALIPLGSLAAGTTAVTSTDNILFRFSYVGDEAITYVIDTSDSALQSGLLRISEESTGAEPLAGAGLRYRDAAGTPHPSPWLSNNAAVTLQSAALVGEQLTLQYTQTLPTGTERAHRYEIELIGKALRVRVVDSLGVTDGLDNFCGFDLGSVGNVSEPVDLRIPHMISTPLAMFTSVVDGSKAFVTTQIDWSKSSAPNHAQPNTPAAVQTTPSSISNSFSLRYDLSLQGGLTAPLDETFWVLVTRELSDTFPETEAQPSPYRANLEGRPVVLFSSAHTSWADYREQLNLFDAWGMDNLAIYSFYWWSEAQPAPGSDPPQTPSHIWVPAKNETAFFDLTDRFDELGYLHGYYTLYSLNADQPHHDVNEALMDADGRSRGMAPAHALGHSLREDTEMRARYGTSLSFSDVLGYRHPKKRTDYDTTDTTRSNENSGVLRDKRALFQQMQDIHEGPSLSEGSIATIGSNYELLYAGFVDSTEATVNTASGSKAANLGVGDPSAPENWWVVPDYALQVTNRTQAPHSNGFYNRFFAELDNSFFPLSDARMDRYRIYSITYGKSGYFHSNGPINGQGNLLAFADMIKEYYLMAGIQADYLGSKIETVEYWVDDALVNLQTALRNSTEANPLDDLRHPKMRLRFESGLTIYLNHSPLDWEEIEVDGQTYMLPEDGWIASNPTTGLLAFSAVPMEPASTGTRIDYARVQDRYEALDGRGTPVSYGGLESSAGWLVVTNEFRGISVTESSTGEISTEQTSEPQVTALSLEGANLLRPNHRFTLRPWATADNGAKQELSYILGDWASSNPDVATVSRAGVVEALGEGSTKITFSWQSMVSTPHTVTVQAP